MLSIFLNYRKQSTKFLGTESEEKCIEYGVPQGYVLGPLLFLIYINDIINSGTLGKFILFADDTNIFVVGDSEKEVYEKANIVLDEVNRYMCSNQLHINISKSCYIHFKPNFANEERMTCARLRPIDTIYSLKLNGQKLKQVDNVKFLGVIIDEKLSWDSHITYLETKLKLSIVIIKRIKRFIPVTEYEMIYNALFLSHLTYCITSWGGTSKTKLSKIFSIQKRCIRLLFGNEYTFDHREFYETCARARSYENHKLKKNFALEHTKPIFNGKSILNLENLYKYHSFMEVFKIIKFQTPISLFQLFNMSHRYHKYTLNLPKLKLDKTMHNFPYSPSVMWNSLVSHILLPCEPGDDGLVIPGSKQNSDMSASTAFVKSKLKSILLKHQKSGDQVLWN